MTWLIENISSVLVLFAVALLVTALVRSLVKAKKNGKSHCSGCNGCNFSGECSRNGNSYAERKP